MSIFLFNFHLSFISFILKKDIYAVEISLKNPKMKVEK
mgnify:CR=1 FL=1